MLYRREERAASKSQPALDKGQVLACLVCRATRCGAGQQLALQAQSAGRGLLRRARHLAPYVFGRTRHQRIARRLLEFIWLSLSSEGAAYDTRSCQRFAERSHSTQEGLNARSGARACESSTHLIIAFVSDCDSSPPLSAKRRTQDGRNLSGCAVANRRRCAA